MGNPTMTTAVGQTDRPFHATTGAQELAGTRFKHRHFEVHAENYMGAGGPPHRTLAAIRENYPLYIHGARMSIGGTGAFLRFAQATRKMHS
jgi:uncharacterized protein (UPF0276 family)